MKWELGREKFTYILRYYLPCMPQFGQDITDKRTDELLSFCSENSVDAVMFYVDLNPYWYYMPDSVEHNEYVVGQVKKAAERLRAANISYQLNYQNLFGSWDGNFDFSKDLGWECYVDEYGRKSKGVACMIGKKFRQKAGSKLLLWAETKPDVIWIDDDMRFHNHRTPIGDIWAGKNGVVSHDFGCFCDRHIKLFNEKNGTSYTREQIVNMRMSGKDTKKFRKLWQENINDTLCETADRIYDTVHSVSPDTRIAIMTSNPDVHSVEGRDWNRFLSSLTGKDKAIMRPTFGPYCEGDPRKFAHSLLSLERLLANASSQYTNGLEPCPEIENTRFTLYSKSVAATDFQLMLSAFEGCRGITMSIFDLEGCRLCDEPYWGELLKKRKADCNRLNLINSDNFTHLGLGLFTAADRVADLGDIKTSAELVAPRMWDETLVKLGLPCRYVTPKSLDDAECVVLDAFSVKQLTDAEIHKCLSKSVLADAGAANELQKRGFGKYLGISVGEKIMCVASSELIHTKKRTDGSDIIIPSRIDGGKWRGLKADGAEILSSLITPDGKRHPGFTMFENSLGGKFCAYASDGSFGDGFCSTFRVELLREIAKKLQPNAVTVHFQSYGLASVKKCGNKILIFIANLSADKISELKITVPDCVKSAEIIYGADSTKLMWENEIILKCGLNMYETAVVSISVK